MWCSCARVVDTTGRGHGLQSRHANIWHTCSLTRTTRAHRSRASLPAPAPPRPASLAGAPGKWEGSLLRPAALDECADRCSEGQGVCVVPNPDSWVRAVGGRQRAGLGGWLVSVSRIPGRIKQGERGAAAFAPVHAVVGLNFDTFPLLVQLFFPLLVHLFLTPLLVHLFFTPLLVQLSLFARAQTQEWSFERLQDTRKDDDDQAEAEGGKGEEGKGEAGAVTWDDALGEAHGEEEEKGLKEPRPRCWCRLGFKGRTCAELNPEVRWRQAGRRGGAGAK